MLALLLACAQAPPEADRPEPEPRDDDQDDDGVDDATDCDDADPAVGAPVEQHVDADADAYGVTELAAAACPGTPGFAPHPGDCDDADAAVNPGASELCAEGDENCDGAEETGAVDAVTWYDDLDDDGFGDDASAIVACDAGTQAVTQGGDCDDGDERVNPGAIDGCWDELDTDCDGIADEDCLEGVHYPRDADVRAVGDGTGLFGHSVCGGADLTGDGVPDFAVSAPYATAGATFVFSGTLAGNVGVADASATLTGPEFTGYAIRCGEDLTGDGLADLAVQSESGAFDELWWPAVWILEGPILGEGDVREGWGSIEATGIGPLAHASSHRSASGELFLWTQDNSGEMPHTYVSAPPGPGRTSSEDLPGLTEETPAHGHLSQVVRCDTDADGTAEVIYGQGAYDAAVEWEGALYRVTAFAGANVDLADADARLVGQRPFDNLGDRVECVGDADGDGADDVATSGPESDAVLNGGGRVWLFTGDGLSQSGEADVRASLIVDGTVSAQAGHALAVDDAGDRPVLWIGAPYDSDRTGILYAIDLDRSGTLTLGNDDIQIMGNTSMGGLGMELAVPGGGEVIAGAMWDVAWDGGYGTAYVFRDQD